jgi:3-hydroxyisobutyrate dehydrogenase
VTVRVAFCGLGLMGAPMAAHVAKAGHELTVWNRTAGKAGDLTALGATEARSAADAVAGAEVVVLMLTGPPAVREVLAAALPAASRGATVLDCSTIGPAAAHEFGDSCRRAGLRYVEAPVAGSVPAATDGTLGVLLGGPAEDVETVLPLVRLWGDPERIVHVGGLGAGNATKLCQNLGLAAITAALGEALRLGADLDLDRSRLLDVLATGPLARAVAMRRASVEAGSYSDVQFSLDLMIKDLGLCLDAADQALPVTAAVHRAATDAARAGYAGQDSGALAGHLADGR